MLLSNARKDQLFSRDCIRARILAWVPDARLYVCMDGSCFAADKLEALSTDCHEEVLQLKIWRSKSIDSNPALGKQQNRCRVTAAAVEAGCSALFIMSMLSTACLTHADHNDKTHC